MNIGFYLENIDDVEKAKILIKSIKENIKQSCIYIVTKHDVNLSDCTIINDQITAHNDLYFVDKVHAASIFEKTISTPYLWIDIDTIFLKPADQFFNFSKDIAVNPVDIRNIGVLKDHLISDVWETTMKHLKMTSFDHYVTTRVSNEVIHLYYNIGMVYVREHRGLFEKTYQTLTNLFHDQSIYQMIMSNPLYRIFYHQLVFSLYVEKLYDQHIDKLGEYINYPLHLMDKDAKKPHIEDLISIRYDTYLNNHEIPEFLKKQ